MYSQFKTIYIDLINYLRAFKYTLNNHYNNERYEAIFYYNLFLNI